MPTNSAFAPLNLRQFSKEDFTTDEGISAINQTLSLLTQRVNAVQGNVGKAAFPAGVDLAGNSIDNVNAVGPEHSAISHAQAEARYSAGALSPQLEAGQRYSLKSVRRLNDPTQTEFHSNFLEGMLSTSPTTNTSTISGSGNTVSITAGYHLRPSGNIVPYAARADTFVIPGGVAIVSITRVGGIVTATTGTPHGLLPSAVVEIAGVTDPSFDGEFVILTTPSPTTFTYRESGGSASSFGGTVSEGVYFYYFLQYGQKTLSVAGPFASDSQQNRININRDGNVLVAVASFAGGGFNIQQSAAGATPPQTTAGVHVLSRL